MEKKRIYAAMTGDIVKSTSLKGSDFDDLRTELLNAVDDVKRWKKGIMHGKAEFFRGDAWQMLISDPAMALRIGVYLRSRIISFGKADTRFSIGLGTVENLSRGRVSLSTGEAFILSGRGLDDLTQYSRITIECPKSVGPLAEWLAVVGQLCDSLISGWTRRQAEIVARALDPKELKQEEIAESLSSAVSRQAVTKALDSANWVAVRAAIRVFEKTDWSLVLSGKRSDPET